MESYKGRDLKRLLDNANEVYDAIRIIELSKREIVHSKGYEDIRYKSIYCGFWQTQHICPDCPQNCNIVAEKILSGIEDSKGRRLMIITKPFIFGDDSYILEMAKDITGLEKN